MNTNVLCRAILGAIVAAAAIAGPALADQATLSGKVTEPNFATQRFWLQADGRQITVLARGASFHYKGHHANIYRMMGTPDVRVTGDLDGSVLHATSVDILTGPRARLQRSEYTDRAIPPFTDDELVPRQ